MSSGTRRVQSHARSPNSPELLSDLVSAWPSVSTGAAVLTATMAEAPCSSAKLDISSMALPFFLLLGGSALLTSAVLLLPLAKILLRLLLWAAIASCSSVCSTTASVNATRSRLGTASEMLNAMLQRAKESPVHGHDMFQIWRMSICSAHMQGVRSRTFLDLVSLLLWWCCGVQFLLTRR